MISLDQIALQTASHAYASENMPSNWDDLSEQDQEQWLSDNRLHAYAGCSNDEFFELIEVHADEIKHAIDTALAQLKEKADRGRN